jgi:hypothetical protein
MTKKRAELREILVRDYIRQYGCKAADFIIQEVYDPAFGDGGYQLFDKKDSRHSYLEVSQTKTDRIIAPRGDPNHFGISLHFNELPTIIPGYAAALLGKSAERHEHSVCFSRVFYTKKELSEVLSPIAKVMSTIIKTTNTHLDKLDSCLDRIVFQEMKKRTER